MAGSSVAKVRIILEQPKNFLRNIKYFEDTEGLSRCVLVWGLPIGGCLFPDALLQLQNTTHALVNALLCDFTGFYSLDYRVESLREHLRTEHDVDTGLDATHGSLAVGVLLGDGSHSVMMRF